MQVGTNKVYNKGELRTICEKIRYKRFSTGNDWVMSLESPQKVLKLNSERKSQESVPKFAACNRDLKIG